MAVFYVDSHFVKKNQVKESFSYFELFSQVEDAVRAKSGIFDVKKKNYLFSSSFHSFCLVKIAFCSSQDIHIRRSCFAG